MTVDEMLARISGWELAQWRGFERLNGPLPDVRGDYNAAVIASTVANALRTKGKGFSIRDFLVRWGRKRGAQTPDEMRTFLIGLTRDMGGRVEGEQ